MTERINSLDFDKEGFPLKSYRIWEGFGNYYGKLLPQEDLEYFDSVLLKRLTAIINTKYQIFGSKSNLQFALGTICFLSQQYQQKKKQVFAELIAEYIGERSKDKQISDAKKNQKLIQERKKEYRKIEATTSGLLINRPGMFIGLTSRGVTISQKGKVVAQHHPDNLSQIVITGQGVSLSSNLVSYCLSRKIPIDFFDAQGTHLGSIINSKYMHLTSGMRHPKYFLRSNSGLMARCSSVRKRV